MEREDRWYVLEWNVEDQVWESPEVPYFSRIKAEKEYDILVGEGIGPLKIVMEV